MNVRTSLENVRIFTFYFVGTNDKLVGLSLTCTDKFPNVPTKLRKQLLGGGQLPRPPPPPPLWLR